LGVTGLNGEKPYDYGDYKSDETSGELHIELGKIQPKRSETSHYIQLLLESYLPQYVESFLKEEGLTMVEMDQVVRQTFFFHLFLDIDRREIDWFITQAERAPVYN